MTILEKRKLAPERDEHLKKGEFTVLNGEYSKNFNVYVVGEKHKEAVDFITGSELMSIGDKERLERLSNELIGKDWFMTFPDFDAGHIDNDMNNNAFESVIGGIKVFGLQGLVDNCPQRIWRNIQKLTE